jgi:hypothetical protein
MKLHHCPAPMENRVRHILTRVVATAGVSTSRRVQSTIHEERPQTPRSKVQNAQFTKNCAF